MTKFIKMFAALCALLFVTACSRVEPGNVGIKAYLLGSSKGVDHEVLGPGRYWIGFNEQLFIFPTFSQNVVWDASGKVDESISFQSAEGLQINADIGITYSVDPAKVPILFQKYRKGIDEISGLYLRNIVRDSIVMNASKLDVETLYGHGKSAFLSSVENDVREKVSDIGINVESIYSVGPFRLPDAVIQRINDKIAATQKAQQRENELRQSEAEAAKRIAEARGEAESRKVLAEAEAAANNVLSKSITNDLLKWRELQVVEKQVDKWDGVVPQITSGNILPMIDLKK